MTAQTTHMNYEAYLDEVTTLITEKYDIADEDAISEILMAASVPMKLSQKPPP